MREYHLKIITSTKGGPRTEGLLESGASCGRLGPHFFNVHSALYGDGKSRYTDVTKIVQEWAISGTWPENWEEVLYATRKPRQVGVASSVSTVSNPDSDTTRPDAVTGSLVIHSAYYGPLQPKDDDTAIDVSSRLRELVNGASLDIVVNNSTVTPNQNPFRGRKKCLQISYSIDGAETYNRIIEEKDWLIIGPARQSSYVVGAQPVEFLGSQTAADFTAKRDSREVELSINVHNQAAAQIQDVRRLIAPKTAAALNDFLIRKFSISPQRLRGPMPIELRDFHRNDLAQLFAELGFKRGAEIGVAEGKYSEVLMKANPDLELLLVDPWHAYSGNPQNKSQEKNEFAFNETKRRIEALGGSVGQMIMKLSMDAVRDVEENSLDFCYIDGHHSYPYVMCDIIEWAKRVRSGGIVALDDVYRLDEARWGAGPMEAIYDYTRAMRINPWWLINAHKSVDAFFVKP